MANCPGGLILHRDETIAGCTCDEDEGGCVGRDLLHESYPRLCWEWWGRCERCGIHDT